MNKLNHSSSAKTILQLTQVALLTAITFVSASMIHIPYGNGGVLHLGDSIIYIAAILFGSRYAAFSGAAGMAMFDLFSPYAVWAPYTFVIKAVMGLIAGSIAQSGAAKGKSFSRNLLAVVAAGIWMCFGYYIAEGIMTGNFVAPLAFITGNAFQFVFGGVIALILTPILRKTGYFN